MKDFAAVLAVRAAETNNLLGSTLLVYCRYISMSNQEAAIATDFVRQTNEYTSCELGYIASHMLRARLRGFSGTPPQFLLPDDQNSVIATFPLCFYYDTPATRYEELLRFAMDIGEPDILAATANMLAKPKPNLSQITDNKVSFYSSQTSIENSSLPSVVFTIPVCYAASGIYYAHLKLPLTSPKPTISLTITKDNEIISTEERYTTESLVTTMTHILTKIEQLKNNLNGYPAKNNNNVIVTDNQIIF